jgi:hypothetical protein
MNIVITAPNATPTALLADLAAGTAYVHKERGNGTYRKVHYLAEGTPAREYAEWIRAQRLGAVEDSDAAPRTMASIAAELHTSVSAVRRVLSDLALTEELEAMDQDELADLLTGGEEVELAANALDN